MWDGPGKVPGDRFCSPWRGWGLDGFWLHHETFRQSLSFLKEKMKGEILVLYSWAE